MFLILFYMLYVCYVYKKDYYFVIKCLFLVFLVYYLKIRVELFRVSKIMII